MGKRRIRASRARVRVGTVKDYSDKLLIQLLKARRPEKFNERLQVKGSAGSLLVDHKITLKRREPG